MELILSRRVHAERSLLKRSLLALAPDELAAPHKRMVDGSAQRLPAYGRVNAVQAGDEVRAEVVVATRVGEAEVEVRRFVQILVGTQVFHRAHVVLLV